MCFLLCSFPTVTEWWKGRGTPELGIEMFCFESETLGISCQKIKNNGSDTVGDKFTQNWIRFFAN